jgi:hypothetical protein
MTTGAVNMGSRLRIELDSAQGFDDTGGNMSKQQPESYEAPAVEEIDTDGKPIAIASGGAVSS